MNDSTGANHDIPDAIDIGIPLRTEYASTLRTLVASIGADLGFSVDEIDDVRLGVSEVFTILADIETDDAVAADPGGEDRHTDAPAVRRCTARFEIGADWMSITMSRGTAGHIVVLDDLAATILRSVVDEYRVVPGGITLLKRATEAAAPSDVGVRP